MPTKAEAVKEVVDTPGSCWKSDDAVLAEQSVDVGRDCNLEYPPRPTGYYRTEQQMRVSVMEYWSVSDIVHPVGSHIINPNYQEPPEVLASRVLAVVDEDGYLDLSPLINATRTPESEG